jgi:hypothetical protein
MSEQEFLLKLDELYRMYGAENMENVDAELFKEDLYELVLLFKDGDS